MPSSVAQVTRVTRHFRWFAIAFMVLAFGLCGRACMGQGTTASGSVQGTVTDPAGAVLPGAIVTVRNDDTGQVKSLTANGSGFYNASGLNPGRYSITVKAAGFAATTVKVVVQIGNTATGNVVAAVSGSTQQVEVAANDVALNTDQSTVQGVLTAEQIDNLPINGRNFLDLAQLEPGVQIQDGVGFDPTKSGYISISFNGVSGRTARILLDGQDISDETVGTTTLNVSQGSIEEFQISRSTLDLSNEITSSGSVTVSTRSGTNAIHGQGFYDFRDGSTGFAALPQGVKPVTQRNQMGGRFGGPLIADKLFYFLSFERLKQDATNSVPLPSEFSAIQSAFPGYTNPDRENYSVGRIDYNAPHGIHLFFRGSYQNNSTYSNAFAGGYSIYANQDNVPAFASGADFSTGKFTHSIRYSYLKFHNGIQAPPALPGVPTVAGAEVNILDAGFASGPNYLGPQGTFQSDKQLRYDGSWTKGNHVLRYGVSYNRILGGGFASFFGQAPLVESLASAGVAKTLFDPAGGTANPLNYLPYAVIFGNGEGASTENPGFGLKAGGQGDQRFGAYVGDSYKLRSNVTFNVGVRYQRDTGRTDSDLAPIPCSSIDPTLFTAGTVPCSGSDLLLDQFGAGLGKRPNQPNSNFGPQGGFAWSPGFLPKTVIRAGVGIYFENNLFNSVLFDRPLKLQKGLFNNTPSFTCGPNASLTFPGGVTVTSVDGEPLADICNQPLGTSAAKFAILQQQYQAATVAAGPQANGNFLGNTLTTGGSSVYDPNYKTTRSLQLNVGFQRELWGGGVLSVDYLRNIGTKFLQGIDRNHDGAARYFNPAAAANAVANTLASCKVSNIDEAIAACPGLHTDETTGAVSGATIDDFAGKGLESGNNFLQNYPAGAFALTPNTGAAFPGANPLVGKGLFLTPNGRSVYNGLQVNFRQQKAHPVPGIVNSNLEVSYAFSRFVSSGGKDQNFIPTSVDYDHPTSFIGPDALDRTHQFSLGGILEFKYGPKMSIIAHVYSPLPTTLTLDGTSDGNAQIFKTDVTGDGTVGDIVPGLKAGSFSRSVSAGSLNKIINNYNSVQAGTLTPAGAVLVANGTFTAAQISALGGVKPTIQNAPANEVGNGLLKALDASFSYPIHFPHYEKVILEPGVNFFNLFNFANFGALGGNLVASGASPGFVNGTAGRTTDRDQVRVGTGSGIFAEGAPRVTEFGLKLTF